MNNNIIERVLISEEKIKERIKELAKVIEKDFAGKSPLMVGILKGSVVFFTDLVRAIDLDLTFDFMALSSYGAGTKSSGEVKMIKDLDRKIEGKSIIIVEDIIDSGYTMAYLKKMLMARNPAEIKICTLLDKPSRREADVHVDYVGFEIENEYVVGYGMDYNGLYRNLPYIGVLSRHVYEN